MKRIMVVVCLIMMAGLLSSCITTGTEQYKAVNDLNSKIAAHKIVSIELADDGKVKKIEFAGTPQFMMPQNQWVEGIKTVIPLVGTLMGSGGVVVPTLEAGGNIIWTDGSNNIEDHRTATGGESGTITGPSDSHDATAPPVVVEQPVPIIVEQPIDEG